MDGTDVPVVPLAGENEKTKSGGKIVMIGYPLGVTKINYEGIIAGYFDRLGSDIYNYLMLQIFASSGSSGSAVIDVNTGKVVGVLVAAKSAYAGLPVIFATPIDYIKHLMQVREQNVETKPIYYPNPDGDN
jgi:S1-C subfamily serine protease